jgi:hypothetical protein
VACRDRRGRRGGGLSRLCQLGQDQGRVRLRRLAMG